MSHFTVLVIGHGVEAALAPYHEFECTGANDQYVQEIDITDDAHQQWENHKEKYNESNEDKAMNANFTTFVEAWYGYKSVPHGSDPDIDGEHKYGYYQLGADGNVTVVVNRTNPNAKWDWYQLGGRWAGFFKLKEGATGEAGDSLMGGPAEEGHADSVLKRDIDFDSMRKEAADEAAAKYTRTRSLMGDAINSYEPWETVLARHGNANREQFDAAREEYNKQPAVKLLTASDEVRWFISPQEFQCTQEEYVQRAVNQVGVPYAVVKDGEWFAKGEMGWWGMSNDTDDQDTWNAKVQALYDELPDDTLLTLVDCHI